MSYHPSLSSLLADFRSRDGRMVGFTSGVFDLLHPGHVSYLEAARKLCDELVVGVNSDASVSALKGPLRPIQGEEARAKVVAGLRSVDHVFLFSEQNNNENIRALKPDLYIKAGDYDRSKLSSAPLVEEYGGKVVTVPFEAGFSSTDLVGTVVERYLPQLAAFEEPPPREKRPAIFLDRDGTVNKEVQYLHEPEKFELIPGVLEGMKLLRDAGYRIVIVTNQPGIGLGYFTKEDFFRVMGRMLREVSEAGILIDKIYFSPYSKADKTSCRKPGTRLVERAVEELNLDLEASYVIGDMTSDIQLAKNAGCRSCLVKTGKGGSDGLYEGEPDLAAENLLEAARAIVGGARPSTS